MPAQTFQTAIDLFWHGNSNWVSSQHLNANVRTSFLRRWPVITSRISIKTSNLAQSIYPLYCCCISSWQEQEIEWKTCEFRTKACGGAAGKFIQTSLSESSIYNSFKIICQCLRESIASESSRWDVISLIDWWMVLSLRLSIPGRGFRNVISLRLYESRTFPRLHESPVHGHFFE
jgi:hypothetical protein